MNLFATRTTHLPRLRCGQAVHINAGATWIPATITILTPTRLGVVYRASTPDWLTGTVAPWAARPADGICLQPASRLRAGDQIVDADGAVHPVGTVRQTRTRWWVIDYTSGERGLVAPGAILRLLDPTPAVSVEGIRL